MTETFCEILKRIFSAIDIYIRYQVVNIDFARPDVPNDARQASVGVWLEKGYTWEHVEQRMEVYAWYKELGFQALTERFYPRDSARQP